MVYSSLVKTLLTDLKLRRFLALGIPRLMHPFKTRHFKVDFLRSYETDSTELKKKSIS